VFWLKAGSRNGDIDSPTETTRPLCENLRKTLKSQLRLPISQFVLALQPVTEKKANRFGLAVRISLSLMDWCGGGDLNPYALRR
jgi:hypothetical protein